MDEAQYSNTPKFGMEFEYHTFICLFIEILEMTRCRVHNSSGNAVHGNSIIMTGRGTTSSSSGCFDKGLVLKCEVLAAMVSKDRMGLGLCLWGSSAMRVHSIPVILSSFWSASCLPTLKSTWVQVWILLVFKIPASTPWRSLRWLKCLGSCHSHRIILWLSWKPYFLQGQWIRGQNLSPHLSLSLGYIF